MPLMTGGHAVVRSLLAEGVDVVFALPGEQVMHIYDGFFDVPGIRLITTRHEQTAAFMADGYARTTGKPGIALVVPGPGAYNAGAALSTAHGCSSPVMLLSGQINSDILGKGLGALHDIHDQLDAMKPVTKWNDRVMSAEAIPATIHEGLRQMATGRPRPVEIEVPRDILGNSADIELIEAELYPPASPDPRSIEQAADLLAAASRPLIWFGGGVNLSGAWNELRQVAEALQSPALSTPEGKGAFPEDHPLSVGASHYGWGAALDVVPQADVIFSVGSRFSFPVNADWAPRPPQKLINLNIDPSEFNKTYPAEVGIAADARVGLEALDRALAQRRGNSTWDVASLPGIKARARQRIQERAPRQLALVDAVRAGVPDNGIVVAGITIIGAWASIIFPTSQPRSFVTASYMATLGFAFPTAMGVKVGNPDKAVVALCGDGGFMFAASDLATAVQNNINVVAIVFNNGVFGASNNDQGSRFSGRYKGTELHNPDFVRFAESFGARGIRVEDENKLPQAIRDAIAGERPTIIDLVTPRLAPPYQMTPPTRG